MEENNLSGLFMKRAMDLAQKGQRLVSPNPMVGCVIVQNNQIIGEGWHRGYGMPHAEVEAVRSIKGDLPPDSEFYVTLEPCSHFGKTPPCADMICKLPVRKVWVSNMDPNPQVSGKGLEKLKTAGIEVETGLLHEEGEELNKRFFTFHRQKRPYIILKWAETGDGFIARKDYSSKWISNDYSRMMVHKWRSEEDAILVGKNTIIHDDPSLNVRDWKGRNPIRVIVDKNLAIDKKKVIFNGKQETLVVNSVKEGKENLVEYVKIPEEEIYHKLVHCLYERDITSLLVEGGAGVHSFFLNAGLWDEIRLFKAPSVLFKEGIPAPKVQGTLTEEHNLNGDHLYIYRNV